MAESQRRGASIASVDDEAQKKRDRMFMVFFFLGLLGLVALMILIAKFLSGQ